MNHLKQALQEPGDTPDQRTLPELVGAGIALRDKFREEYPELDSLPRRRQAELWKEYCGLPVPVCPSVQDPTREASCLKCKDALWITPLKKDGKHDYTKSVPCAHCTTWNTDLDKYIWEQTGIPEAKRQSTFSSFQAVFDAHIAFEAVYMLAKGEAEYIHLLLYGKNGNGKTHLAMAACIEAKERGKRPIFRHFGELLSDMRRAMDNDGKTEEFKDEVKECEFLALDDIGMNSRVTDIDTDWQQSVLEEIINYRYAHELPLICTTNKDLKQLSPAILSRFRDSSLSKLVLNDADDYRPKKKG